MIENIEVKTPIIVQLQQSSHQFYLTGSRYFGGANLDSDWDFFAEWSIELSAWLQALGFKEKEVLVYQDETVLQIMLFTDIDAINVHIQLVKGASHKNAVQSSLPKALMQKIPHDCRHLLWDYALTH